MEIVDFFGRVSHGTPIALRVRSVVLITMEKQDYFSGHQSYRVQKTLRKPLTFRGLGLHSGVTSKVVLVPAEANSGITFLKKADRKTYKIPAHYESVVATSLATTLGLPELPDSKISTVEHLLASLYALGITNLSIEVQGPEIPILDGSSLPFVEGILDVGIQLQNFSSRTLRVLKPVKVYAHGAICELLPRDNLRLTTSIDFNHPQIGTQTFAMDLTPRTFAENIGSARTFGFLSDLEKLKARRLALGASLENVLGFSENGVLNSEGMRFEDECVRHKWLDALGDLSLCGSWVEGELVSFRGGHAIHFALLKALQNHPSHWELVPAESLHTYSLESQTHLPAAQVITLRK